MTEPELFDAVSPTPAPGNSVPLAHRLRPDSFDEFVGQRDVARVLRELAVAGKLPSLVLWGPPGSGKTTLARLLAKTVAADIVALSAVTAGVADLRKAVQGAALARRAGRRTVLFIDEIHRFNKAQQDAILPHVEDGTVTLVGATTENPSFEVIGPLLSRSRVFRLEALDPEELEVVIGRGLELLDRELDSEARNALVEISRGDARVALNALEVAAALQPEGRIGPEPVRKALQEGHLLYDRLGDQHYDIISAFIKSVRGSDPDAAVYWLARMLEAGEDPMFVARRLVILAAEDIGLADPNGLAVAVAAQQAAHFVGLPEATLPLSEATLYLALAPKSNSAMRAYGAAREAVSRTGNLAVPLHLRNAVTGLMKKMNYGRGYRYPHDHPGAQGEQAYLPDQLRGQVFYAPGAQDQRPGSPDRAVSDAPRPPVAER